jgi:hypothetical protein
MAKRIYILIIFLIVFGFFNIKKIKEAKAQTLPEKVFVAAMRTQYTGAGDPFVDGYFYVPNISAPRNPKWVRVMSLFQLDNNGLSFEGDQTGGSNDYFTNVPDGKVDGKDRDIFSPIPLPTNEGDPKWDYMADINADKKITIDDKNIVFGNFGHGGNNITNLTNVTILFRDSLNNSLGEYPLDAQGFVSIPANAANFTVKKTGTPIGAYVYFYAQRPNLMGWAWSENIGWISLNSVNCNTDGDGKYEGSGEAIGSPPADCPTSGRAYNYGVNAEGLPTDTIRNIIGYGWSDRIGWIKFDPPSPYPSGQASIPTQFEDGTVFGWARACGAAPNPSTCGGGTGGNTAAGGWEGWINMTDIINSPSLYEVTVGNGDVYMEPGEEFKGWAWGGGGSDLSNAVIGWISFNRSNTASPIDYKVTYQPVNSAPNTPSPSHTIDRCCYGCSPQVAQGVSVTLSWTYSDPEGDPQTAYEIWVDDDSNFTGAKFNYQASASCSSGSTCSYTLNLSLDGQGIEAPYPEAADWLSQLAWNTTYYWKVRVKDSGSGKWSSWSSIDSFTMPAHAAPYVNFSWCPTYPAVYQSTQFCSVTEAGVCDAATCAPPTDETECYDAAGNVVNCANWSWVFTDATSPLDSTPPAEISGSTSEYQNPREIKFQSSGSKNVTLTVTDSAPTSYQCTKTLPVNLGLPLPHWKEIPPF